MRQQIVITLQVEGLHHWPGCDIPEVDFLNFPHRHVFWIKAWKEVSHADRDIEFIVLKREMQVWLLNWTTPRGIDFGPKSCEMIAEMLIDKFNLAACEVLEDNENGAYLIKE